MKIDISFISINYNSTDFTIKLVDSILKNTDININYEIIIVDNASESNQYVQLINYAKNIENIIIIKNKINSGFASANMLGINYANGKYYFFINNDTLLLNDVASIMKSYLDVYTDIALCTANIVDTDGKYTSSHKLFVSITKELLGNSLARKFNTNNFPSNKVQIEKPTLVDVISGSCMFFRASTFCDIGGFDTSFFLYCEEEDICKRVWNKNQKIILLPDAKIFHSSGGSTKKSYAILREYYISYNLLLKKHFNLFSYMILKSLVLFKLFRRAFKGKDNIKLFIFALKGFPSKESLKYKQKIIKTK
jgi:GT2 family glycosyltransferase